MSLLPWVYVVGKAWESTLLLNVVLPIAFATTIAIGMAFTLVAFREPFNMGNVVSRQAYNWTVGPSRPSSGAEWLTLVVFAVGVVAAIAVTL